ncbi:hypothetical protein CRG98_030745 [Punica granatum]|uniref:Uncharacterized protein n=1 Tax=Punica granatum TaxID=22663 RepID=A0A2I0IY08_PUNGR|nr:hypothetical protein CRG98_030745 [Punica granatum]
MGRTSRLDQRSKGNGPRPVSRRAVGIRGSGGGSRPWTPRKSRKSAIWGSPGRQGSRAAGERCLACPNIFFSLGRRFTGSRSTLPGPARFA